MNRKVLSIIGVLVLIAVVSSCSSNPEKGLLDRYFNALSLKDNTTLRTMAITPATFAFTSYEILSVSEEVIQPYGLKDLADQEAELKKQLGAIAEYVGSCVFDLKNLDDGADPEKVNFYLNGEVVPYDPGCSKGIGWDWRDNKHDSVEFCPQICEEMGNQETSEITATFGCKTIEVI